jgi:DnaJ-class molecular chaperone
MDEDFYKVLGVSRSASQAEIQKAYRALARKHHPDLSPDDKTAKERFQKIQRAYEVLSDEKKREMYDRFGSQFEQMGANPQAWSSAGGGGGQMPPEFSQFDFSQLFGGGVEGGGGGFEDLFRQFGGGGAGPQSTRRRGRRSSMRGADASAEVEVPFQTAAMGGTQELLLRRPGGTTETIRVKIPAGIEEGKTIRLRGQGEPGAGGAPAGDLLDTIRIAAHPYYSRKGLDLDVKLPITLGEAALGAKVDVPTPHGVVTVTIPPGASSGKRIRLRGQGIHKSDSQQGDLYAELQIVLPKQLDEESRELIRQLQARLPDNPRAELRW